MNDRTIAQWLVRNERYQTPESKRTPIPETDEAWEPYDTMANIYIKKIEEIPDVHLYDVDSVHYSFRICLGSPKIHGRRVMRLPEISLVFAVTGISSTRVYFAFSDRTDDFQELRDIYKRLMDKELRHSLSVSCHPHISADGMPCLGDFSQPWAQTYASNDLPMLINVAKSFLNNWTARDAYWNINTVNRKWQDYAKDRGIPFKDFLMYHQVLNRLAQNIEHRNLYPTNILRMMFSHDGYEQAEAKGMDLLDLWTAHVINGYFSLRIQDKKAEKWGDVIRGMARWMKTVNDITVKSHDAVIQYCQHSRNLFAITEDVIHNTAYTDNHGIDRRADIPDSMMAMFKDSIIYAMKDIVHMQDASRIAMNKLHEMLHRMRNDESIEDNVTYLLDGQVDYALGAFFCREWFTDGHQARVRGFLSLVRLLLEVYPEGFRSDLNNDVITDFVKFANETRYGEGRKQYEGESHKMYEAIGAEFYELLSKLFDNPVWEEYVITDKVYPVVTRCTMREIEKHYKTKAERISNGKAKFEQATGNDSSSNVGENQLSASQVQ